MGTATRFYSERGGFVAKYLTVEQRETIIWIVELADKLENDAAFWKKDQREILQEMSNYLKDKAVELMDGISRIEGNAVIKLAKRVRPALMVYDFTGKETEDKITVDADHYYTLAEHSLEFCKFTHIVSEINKMTNAKKIKEYLKENFKYQDCKNPETCGLRQVLLHFLVPPLTEEGKCQYWRG